MIAQEHAEPIGPGALRIADHHVERFADRLVAVERGAKPPRRRHGAQMPQERLVVHPIQSCVVAPHMRRGALGRQCEEVACPPRNLESGGHVDAAIDSQPRGACAPHHEEELARGVGIGDKRVAGVDPHEVRTQPRRGGRPRTAEGGARVERQDAGRPLLVERGSEPRPRDRRNTRIGQRIGSLSVIVKPGGCGEPLHGIVMGSHGLEHGSRIRLNGPVVRPMRIPG
jgi:hypothetical protein